MSYILVFLYTEKDISNKSWNVVCCQYTLLLFIIVFWKIPLLTLTTYINRKLHGSVIEVYTVLMTLFSQCQLSTFV